MGVLMMIDTRLVITIVGMLAMPSAVLACEPLLAMEKAAQDKEETAVAAIVAAAVPADCSVDDKVMIGRLAALAAFNRIAGAVAGGQPLEQHFAELDGLKTKFGGPWQVLDALGEIYRERKDYANAARWFQAALEDSANTTLTPDWMAPTRDYIVRMDHLASEMRLASPEPVGLVVRGGCTSVYRSVTLKKKSTPVRFVFGTAEFTPEGEKSANDLAQCLKAGTSTVVTLIGHTDPVGSSEANQELSVLRAEALGKYIAAAGYKGEIRTEGRGEDEPFKPDDASAYDEEMLNQLNRRVDADLEN